MTENELILAINADIGDLFHSGVIGQHPEIHLFGKYQNHAKYARGNPKYGSAAKRAFGKFTGADMETRKILANITSGNREERRQAKSLLKSARLEAKGLKADKKKADLEYKVAQDNYDAQKGRVKSAQTKAQRHAEKLNLLRAKQERDIAKNDYKSYKYGLAAKKEEARQLKAYAKNLKANSKSINAGESDAIIDLGLKAGWGKTEQIAARYGYFTRHQDQAKSTLGKALRMITPGTKINQSYIDAYNATVMNAFNMYGIGRVEAS